MFSWNVPAPQNGTVPWWQALPHVANVVTVTSAEELLKLLRKVRVVWAWACLRPQAVSDSNRPVVQASTMSKLVAVEYLAGHCSSCRSLAPKVSAVRLP